MEWQLTLATAVALLGLFAACETVLRRGFPPEATRRIAHTLGAASSATFPLYLRLRDVLALAAAFTVLLTWTWRRRALRSIHGVSRPTLGAPTFPIGLALAALVAWPHPGAFALAALVLALGDTGAAVVGERMGGPGWRVVGGQKHASGSLAMFLVSLLLAIAFGIPGGDPRLLGSIVAAALLTAIEGTIGYGLDNLLLPPVAAVLGHTMLGL